MIYLYAITWSSIILKFYIKIRNKNDGHVKRSVIISNKYGIYELPDQLPNDLRLRILVN